MGAYFRGSAIALLFLSCTAVSSVKTPYFTSGSQDTIIEYDGTIQIGDDANIISRQVKVLPEYIDVESGESWIVQEVIINASGKTEIRYSFYAVRDSGVFCVAESSKSGSNPEKLDKPYLVAPSRPDKDLTWKVDLDDARKKMSLDYVVETMKDILKIGETTFECVVIKGTGYAKVFGMSIPTTRRLWLHKDLGMIQQITVQEISNTQTITTLRMKIKN